MLRASNEGATRKSNHCTCYLKENAFTVLCHVILCIISVTKAVRSLEKSNLWHLGKKEGKFWGLDQKCHLSCSQNMTKPGLMSKIPTWFRNTWSELASVKHTSAVWSVCDNFDRACEVCRYYNLSLFCIIIHSARMTLQLRVLLLGHAKYEGWVWGKDGWCHNSIVNCGKQRKFLIYELVYITDR